VHYRRLGKTGLEVSKVSYRALRITKNHRLGAEDDESLQALNRAIDLDLNFTDTALAYGEGQSERLVGQMVRERDETVYVATKILPKSRLWPSSEGLSPDETFPGRCMRECTQQSLNKLELEAIDVQQGHVWENEWVGEKNWLEAVEDLKREGKIRFFGTPINDHTSPPTL
jgi:aryl-alcohol dehydrogenase-like predicted oxidoreductase